MLRKNTFMCYEWNYFNIGSFKDISVQKLVCVANIFELILQENKRDISL